ncbi:hypothetical protein JXR93_03050 [bacterium]|nr:hypothetical protein [bacterium]
MSLKMNIPSRDQEDVDVLLPVMSLLLILIPVLVGNMAFYHLHSVSVNTPGASVNEENSTPQKKSEMKVMLRVKVASENFIIDLLNEDTGDSIYNKDIVRDRNGIVSMRKELKRLHEEYKKLDVILLSSYKELKYGELLPILDEGIKTIVAGENDEPVFKIVVVPEGV